jgi:hypothetical protein
MRSLVAGRNTVTLAFFACLVFRVGDTALGQKVLGSASQSGVDPLAETIK